MIKFFEKFPEILAVMSTREDGNMKLNFDGKGSVNDNRKKFCEKNRIAENSVISALLDHGDNIKIVHQNHLPRFVPKCDGLISMDENVFLSITAADCYPVLFYDPVARIISLIHVGWRGAVSGIISKTIGYNLIKGCDQANLRAEVGPGICQNHFEFNRTDLCKLGTHNDAKYYYCGPGGKAFIDIKKIIFSEIARHGVLERNIKFSPECTYCLPEKYFSYRRDGKNSKGQVDAMMIVFGMKDAKVKEKAKLILAEEECPSFA